MHVSGHDETFEDGTTQLNGTESAWKSAYSRQTAKSGKWLWRIEINHLRDIPSMATLVAAGVSTERRHHNGFAFGTRGSFGYCNKSGNIFGLSVFGSRSYGQAYGQSDIVGVSLDLDMRTLVFTVNGVYQGFAQTNLPDGDYSLVVSVFGLQSVSIVRNETRDQVSRVPEALLERYERLFERNDKDITFRLRDGETAAHRIILSAASEVFEQMFSHRMSESKTGIVELPDISRASMRVFLRLIYTGQINPEDWEPSPDSAQAEVPFPILVEVLVLAKKYLIPDVVSEIVQVLKSRLARAQTEKDVQAFEDIFALGIKHDLVPLNLAALDAARNFCELTAKYSARQLCPEVQHALEAIWSTPPVVSKKRRLYLS
eukprot:TRINITY_DN38424_c0_g1_i1.p1 TRINITY_DN38424_c0_g1~~TRINITY_DN38424_c0_g1_i1.p1  ORF type:complete len:373 (+),score=56.48 TRINITY_DN38424_c0_g1_i1:34-1152(+)